jgi:bile acid-coenzyme A ligase
MSRPAAAPASEEMPIGTAFTALATARPEAIAVVFEDASITRGELESRTNRLARAYQRLGVTHDSLVTIGLPNGIEFIAAVLATWKAGATPQPVSSRLPAIERDKLLELAAPALAVGFDPAEVSCRAIPGGWAPDPTISDAPLAQPPATSWKAPTSGGSTGRPKLIRDRRPATTAPTTWIAQLFRMTPDDVVLATGPLYHNAVFSSAMAALITGARVVVMPRFDPLAALDLVARERVSWMYAVPTMMHRIWRLPDDERQTRDVSTLRVVYHTGAPCPPWLKRAWIDWLGPEAIWEIYAATEAHAATVISGAEWLAHEGSVGRPLVGEIKILDASGHELAANDIGEVWMRPGEGRRPPYEYIGSTARQRDGWESLGDLGRLDGDGYLYLADRDTDMILVGGANVFPAEVEAALDEHPAVLSSCVIGLPDDDMGNRVHALVQLREDVTDDELSAFLAARIVRYKLPRSFERVATPLRDDAGKVRRSALRTARIVAADA